MVAILMYYQKLCTTLLVAGFKLNPYDLCVTNQMVNGKQQTIFWHVDNCKLSHVDPKVNYEWIEVLKH